MGKVMMRLFSALTQLGVRRMILSNACRVEKAYFASHNVDQSKYLPELMDGLEQAVCTRLPQVQIEKRFRSFVEDSLDELCPPQDLVRLLCHPGDGCLRVSEAVSKAVAASPSS